MQAQDFHYVLANKAQFTSLTNNKLNINQYCE